MSYLLRFIAHLPDVEASCSSRPSLQHSEPELHQDTSFESKAFLFSNDEVGEKYDDISQQ